MIQHNNGIQSTNQLGGTFFVKPKDRGVPKDESWYMQYAQYVAAKYNPIIPRFSNVPLKPNEIPERWASKCLQNEAYVKTEQDEKTFEFLGMDEGNNPLPTKFIKETTPFVIFKHILGNICKSVMSLPDTVYANAITNEALRDKQLSINLAKIKIEFKEEFEEMKRNGVGVNPIGGQDFKSEDDVDDYAKTMQDSLSSFFTAQAKDFLYSQHWEEKCCKMAEYLIPSYFCRVGLEPRGKDIEWTVYRPAQCVWDNTYDDELGRKQRFQAVVVNSAVPELYSLYEWSNTEKNEIQSIATDIPNNGDTIVQLNNMQGATNLVWWGMLSRTPSVAIVKAKWISWDEETDTETWFECDLIGNKYVRNAHKCNNLVVNKDGTINPPYLDFIPEVTYGQNSSIINKMREISGTVMGINAKILALIARAKGKVPVFMGSQFPAGVTQQSLLRQIASGLVFVKDVDIDQINEEAKRQKLVDVIDLTAAIQDIQIMRQEVMYWENKMRDMASTPLAALGSQTQIIGARVQEQTIEQSTYGMLPLYRGFMLYVNNILNAQSQMKKNIISTLDNSDNLILQVSPRERKFFEITKEFSLADLQIYLTQSDQIDEAEKQHIRDIAERQSQIPNTWFDALDAAMMMTFSTKTELVNYMTYKKKTWEAKQEAAQAKAEAMAAQQSELNRQNQLAMSDGQNKTGLAKEAMAQEHELEMTDKEHGHNMHEKAFDQVMQDTAPPGQPTQ